MEETTKDSLPAEQQGPPVISAPSDPLFFGPNGLRAGWRLAIYLTLYFVLRYTILFLAQEFFSAIHVFGIKYFFFVECLEVVIAVVPAVIMSRLEDRPLGDYGLPARAAFRKNFWLGALWGFAAFSVLAFLLRGAGALSFAGFALHGFRALKFAGFWALMFLVVALREEFLFRGYTLFTLAEGVGFWPAAALLAVWFGAIHQDNPGESWTGLLGAAAIGLFLCFTRRRTGTLWFALGVHLAWDWSETFFYSVPDSGLVLPGHLLNASLHGPLWLTGGSVGPEASVLLFVVIAAMWIVFDRVYPPKPTPHTDDHAAMSSSC